MSEPQFNFGANTESVQEDSRMPQLDTPFLGEAYLQDVRIDNELGSSNYRVLIMEFVCLPPNEANFKMNSTKQHRIVEWEPRDEDLEVGPNDDVPRVQKQMDRLAYRLKYWIGEEEAINVVQMQGDSLAEAWDSLRERIVKAMDPHVPNAAVENPRENDDVKIVRIKVNGSVYYSQRDQTQKSSLGVPNYKGVISDENSEYPVSLSQNEQESNREWAEFQNSAPSSADEVTEDTEYEF